MNGAHIHLLLTHIPITGTIIGVGILVYGLYANNDSIKKVALVTFILMAMITIPVFLSGEEAEEVVENITGISEDIIEEHEEFAEKAIWFMGLSGIFSLISLFAIIKKLSFARATTIVALISSLLTAGFFVRVGFLGGQIQHSEIRANNTEFRSEKEKGIKERHRHDENEAHD